MEHLSSYLGMASRLFYFKLFCLLSVFACYSIKIIPVICLLQPRVLSYYWVIDILLKFISATSWCFSFAFQLLSLFSNQSHVMYHIYFIWLSRYLPGYSVWRFPTSPYILPSSCIMCICSMYFCCALCTYQLVIIWCYTSRSSLCCHPIVET